jgi:hypothetical protein
MTAEKDPYLLALAARHDLTSEPGRSLDPHLAGRAL